MPARGEEMRSWEVLRDDVLLHRPPWLTVHQHTVRLPGGRVIDDFYRVVLSDYAVVAAQTAAGQFVLVRGYCHALGRDSLCAPAGSVEPGEDPLETARRELLEETGYVSEQWESLGNFLTDGNRHCGTAHLFRARAARCIAPANCGDETEAFQVELLEPAELDARVESGDVALLPTIAVLSRALRTAGGAGKGLTR